MLDRSPARCIFTCLLSASSVSSVLPRAPSVTCPCHCSLSSEHLRLSSDWNSHRSSFRGPGKVLFPEDAFLVPPPQAYALSSIRLVSCAPFLVLNTERPERTLLISSCLLVSVHTQPSRIHLSINSLIFLYLSLLQNPVDISNT